MDVLIETRSIKLERLHENFWEKSQNYGFVPDSQILSSLLDFQSSPYIYHLCSSQPTFWSKHAFCHLSRGSSCAQNLPFSINQYRQVVFSYSMLQAAFGQAKIRGVAGAKLQRSYLLVKGQNRQCWWQSRFFFFRMLIGPKWGFHYRHMAWANESTQEHSFALDSWLEVP